LQKTASPEAESVVASFNKIKKSFPEEFEDLNLQSLVPTFISPLVSKSLGNWSVVKSPELASELLNSWKNLLTPENLQEIYTSLVFPTMQRQISFWDVTDPEPMEKLFESLKNTFEDFPHTYQPILDECILPRVRSYLSNEWDAKKCKTPVHQFVFPWLQHADLSDTFPIIRKSLVSSLTTTRGWKVVDDSVFGMISPWKKIMDAKSFNTLINKTIIPQLTKTMSSLVVNPADQDVETFKALLAWSSVVQPETMASLIEGEFMLNWLNVLYSWCNTAASSPTLSKELGEFYLGWKGLLSDALSDDIVCEYLHSALCIIEAKCDEADLETVKPPKKKTMSFSRALERRQIDAQAKDDARRLQQKKTVSSKSSYVPGVSMSFRDLAISKAEDANIYVSITEKAVGGKDVYEWGERRASGDNVTVYFDGNLVYARGINGGKEYKLVSLNELL
jgi:tuftelin-interacting protein 11